MILTRLNRFSLCLTPPRFAAVTRPSAASSNIYYLLILFSLIALECKKMRVKVTKVGTIDNFNNCMLRVLQERKKAENLFLDDIEAEIQQKEQFLREQIEVLQDMSTNFNILLEHKSVVAVAAEVIKGAMEAEEVKRQSEIEEKKH